MRGHAASLSPPSRRTQRSEYELYTRVASVFFARDLGSNRPVAVKTIDGLGQSLIVSNFLTNDIDVGQILTTSPDIDAYDLAVLDDDKHLLPADNIAPIVRYDLLESAPKLRLLLDNVSAALTTADVATLNRQVTCNHTKVATVAAAFLRTRGLTD